MGLRNHLVQLSLQIKKRRVAEWKIAWIHIAGVNKESIEQLDYNKIIKNYNLKSEIFFQLVYKPLSIYHLY